MIDLFDLLRERHAKDVFVPECKNGPTYAAGLRIMDAWAMRRSYTRAAFFGYEVKESRSDFIRDTKWRDYLAYCTDFYFVCPWEMIKPDELPSEAGLLYGPKSGAGSRLWTKKKAPSRDVTPPVELFMYILMTRAQISRDHQFDAAGYWREWLNRKNENHYLGHTVSKKIREHVDAMQEKVQVATAKVERAQNLIDFLAKHGLDHNSWDWERRLVEKLGGRDPVAEEALRLIANHAEEALVRINGGS